MAFNLPSFLHGSTNLSDKKNLDNILNDFFGSFYQDLPVNFFGNKIGLTPRVNISESGDKYFIEADLPGIKPEDVEVKLDNAILTIKGKSEESVEEKNRDYYMRERRYGAFQRSINLPSNVKETDIKAHFKDGVLKIEIPKDNSVSKQIEIKVE